MEVLIASLWVAMCLYLLFETSVVYSYLSALPQFVNRILDPLLHFSSYELDQKQNRNWSLSYTDYVVTNHGGFMINLFTCRYCLGAWLAIASAVGFGIWEWIPAVYFLSQLGYGGFKVADNFLTRTGAGGDTGEV